MFRKEPIIKQQITSKQLILKLFVNISIVVLIFVYFHGNIRYLNLLFLFDCFYYSVKYFSNSSIISNNSTLIKSKDKQNDLQRKQQQVKQFSTPTKEDKLNILKYKINSSSILKSGDSNKTFSTTPTTPIAGGSDLKKNFFGNSSIPQISPIPSFKHSSVVQSSPLSSSSPKHPNKSPSNFSSSSSNIKFITAPTNTINSIENSTILNFIKTKVVPEADKNNPEFSTFYSLGYLNLPKDSSNLIVHFICYYFDQKLLSIMSIPRLFTNTYLKLFKDFENRSNRIVYLNGKFYVSTVVGTMVGSVVEDEICLVDFGKNFVDAFCYWVCQIIDNNGGWLVEGLDLHGLIWGNSDRKVLSLGY